MNQEMVLGVIRHILTIVGGVVVTKGYADTATVTTIVGGVLAAIGVGWSIWTKRAPPVA